MIYLRPDQDIPEQLISRERKRALVLLLVSMREAGVPPARARQLARRVMGGG